MRSAPDKLRELLPRDWDPEEPAFDFILDGIRAVELIESVAAGEVTEASETTRPESTYAILRDVAQGVIAAAQERTAQAYECDALATAAMQRIRLLRSVMEPVVVPYGTTLTTIDERVAAARDFAAALNKAFIGCLKACGRTGKQKAAEWLAKDDPSKDPWRLWRLEKRSAPGLMALVKALWMDEVRSSPALVQSVHEDVITAHSKAFASETSRGQRTLRFGSTVPVIAEVSNQATTLPALPDDTVAELSKLVQRGASLLGSITAHRILRWEIMTGFERVMAGITDARAIKIDGGWDGLADQLGIGNSNKLTQEARAIVHAQACCWLSLPDGSRGNLLAVRDIPAVGRRKSQLEIVLGTILLPHYGFQLPNKPEHKRLVPIVELPPMVGRPADHSAQATASMLVMRELRRQARDLYLNGAVRLTLEDWAVLFSAAHLPSSLIGRVLERWTHDDTDGPAFLHRVDADAYTLGNTHARARSFLLEAGKIELDSSDAGRRSAAKRRRLRSPK